MKQMTDKQLLEHLDNVLKEYKGESPALFMAVGALFISRSYGWKPVRVILSHAVYLRSQKILKLDFKEIFPEETELSDKVIPYKIIKNMKEFWGIIRGNFSIQDYGVSPENRRAIG